MKIEFSKEEQRDLIPRIKAFVRDELLFTVRQRVMDLQQQLAVTLQGIVATEIIVRNNKELIRGVDRALTVTVSAFRSTSRLSSASSSLKN